MSEIVDQEQLLSSSSSTASDSFPVNEAKTILTSPTLEDFQLDNSDAGAAKKPAWNMPTNGVTAEAGVVMDAESWPALSGTGARASPKSPSTNSLKTGSSQELAVESLSSPKEVGTSILTPNSTPNQVNPSHHKSMKRGGGSSSHNSMSANNSLPHAPPIQQGAMVDPAPSNLGKSGGEPSSDNTNKNGGQRGGTYGGNESHPKRNSFQRSNSGPLTHGSHRRNHDRQDWGNRSFGSRESQRTGFSRGPTPNAAFIPPSHPFAVQPFVTPYIYTDMQSPMLYVPGPHPDSLRYGPMVPIQSMFYPMADPYLPSKIVNQIDYYFSNENLVKDTFLRQKMDAEGWVSMKLISGFKKVMQLTDNIELILDAIKTSNVVEVQGEKVRRKFDWMKWIMPPLQTTVTSPQSIKSSENMLAAHLNSVALDEKAAT